MLPSQTAHGAGDDADLCFLVVGHILHHKYYSDKGGTKEIKKADTMTEKRKGGSTTAKLENGSKSPGTGDTSSLALWNALLFVGGGAAIGTTVVSRRKKYNR